MQSATTDNVFLPPAHWQTYDLATLDDWDVEPLQVIVDGLIARGNLVEIAAPSQTAKTLFALYLARYFAQGGRLFDRLDVHPVQRVAYFVLEDPARRVLSRLLDTDQEFKQRPDAGSLTFHVCPGFALTNPAMFEWLESEITNQKYDVILLDTYQRATPGLQSIDESEQSRIWHRLANMTRLTGVTLIVLDHTRKRPAGKTKHGSLDIADVKGGLKVENCDCVILMERVRDRTQVEFQAFSKDFDEPIAWLLDVSPAGSGEPKFQIAGDMGTPSKRRSGNVERVLVAIPERQWIAAGDITAKTGLAPATVRRALKELVDSGDIEHNGKKNKQSRYRVNHSVEMTA